MEYIMAKMTEQEAINYLNQAKPIAKELYAKNEDYRRLVAAYYLRLKCRKNIWLIGINVGRLNNQRADFLVSHTTGNFRFDNGEYPWPINDEMYINMYYMQRSYLAIIGLGQKILSSPQGELYKKLYALEGKLEAYNAEYWYNTHKIDDNGALLVDTEYSKYFDISISRYVSAIHAFKEADTRRYLCVSNKDKKVYEVASEIKKDVNDFLEWNGWKNPNMTIPAGFVYFGSIKR